MTLTFLTQYYPPETGAPQNRLHSLARHLKAFGHSVDIITAMPNYPRGEILESYRWKMFCRDSIDDIIVQRCWIYASKSNGIVFKLLSYFSFVITSLIVGLRSDKSDYLLCESPPLFLGMTAVILAKRKGAKLIFNVSDLWPESAEKLGIVGDGMILRLTYRLEAWLYRRAYLVTGQTQGIVSNIGRRFPKVRTLWLPNGVDKEAYTSAATDRNWRAFYGLEGKKLFIYAGILGHAQGLEVIIKAAFRLKARTDIAFVLIGDGPLKRELEVHNDRLSANVVFIPNQPKANALGIVSEAYACIIPLKKLDLFKGAIPSKIFDSLALGIPILLGVEGEAKELFIDRAQAGLCFEPENEAQLEQAILGILLHPQVRDEKGMNGRFFVMEHFDRGKIAQKFLQHLTHQVHG